MKNTRQLEVAIREAINRASAENESNTPDFILAEYLMDCLDVFNRTVNMREEWYGRAKTNTRIDDILKDKP
jgi:hypothetical protein